MKKVILISLVVVMVSSLLGVGVAFAGKGNNTPQMGTAYTLNIIGVKDDHPKNAEMDCGNGHRIFVKLGEKGVKTSLTDIYLKQGDFAVLDCNGTDGRAEFQLPKPEITSDGNGEGCISYSVYIKALGKPGGKARIRTCMEDPGDPLSRICSTESHVAISTTGNGEKKYINVTKELLTICVCEFVEDKWVCERVGIFSDEFKDYLWEYDNYGLKHAQLKFYMDETCYDAKGWKCPTPDEVPPWP